MAASAFSFALMVALYRLLIPDVPSQVAVFWRAVGMSLTFGTIALLRGIPLLGHTPWLLFWRGLIGWVSVSCYFASVEQLPLGDAILFQYSNPLFVAMLAPWMTNERATLLHWLLVLLALAGLALVVGAHGVFTAAIGIALVGSIGNALAYISVKQLTLREHPLTILFWFPAVCVPATLVFASATDLPLIPHDGREIFGHAIVTLAGLLGQIFLTLGLARSGAVRGTAITMSAPVHGLLFGFLFFGEVPGLQNALGAALVLSALWLLVRSREKVRTPSATEA
jgi:drug/metabolite transporter (DMT)-like permease